MWNKCLQIIFKLCENMPNFIVCIKYEWHILSKTDIDECSSDPCQNGATCYDSVDFYNCTCLPWISKGRTVKMVRVQDDHIINPHPSCKSLQISLIIVKSLVWFVGFYNYMNSNTSFTETNECSSNPCQNGGSCSDSVDFYNCTCLTWLWRGELWNG